MRTTRNDRKGTLKTTMKRIRISVCLVLAVLLVSFAACKTDKKVTGGEKSWGRYTMLVPDEMYLKGGSVLNSEDPKTLKLTDRAAPSHYFLFNLCPLENCLGSIEGTRSANEGAKDVSVELGGVEWKGVEYELTGTPAFQVAGEVNGESVLVSSFGYKADGNIAAYILSSIQLSPAE